MKRMIILRKGEARIVPLLQSANGYHCANLEATHPSNLNENGALHHYSIIFVSNDDFDKWLFDGWFVNWEKTQYKELRKDVKGVGEQ